MTKIRRVLLATVALASVAAPALAQELPAAPGSGGSLAFVWGWILVAGILIMIVGTSLGVRGQR